MQRERERRGEGSKNNTRRNNNAESARGGGGHGPRGHVVGQPRLKLGQMTLCGKRAKWNKLRGRTFTYIRHSRPNSQSATRTFAWASLTVAVEQAIRDFFGPYASSPRLTSFIGHDDDDGFRPVSLRIEDAQGHQVLRVRLQPRQSVLLQRQKKGHMG